MIDIKGIRVNYGNINNQIVTDGLVLHIDAANPLCYDGNSGYVNDLSIYHDYYYNSTGIPSGIENGYRYFLFDGVNTGMPFNITSQCSNNINTITLDALIYAYDLADRQIASKGYGYQYRFRVSSGGYLWIYDLNGGELQTSLPVINLNTWYHVAATLGPNGRNLYVNGDLVASNTIPYNPLSKFSTTTGHFVGFNDSGLEKWRGRIATSTRYNRVLTVNEIKQNYNVYKNRYNI